MTRVISGERGFTLTEVLVACAIVAFVMGGLFSVLTSGQQAFLVGSNQAETQQSLRLALYRMTQEIRNAGYCPTCGTGTPPITPFPAVLNATATGFTIQNDWNGDWNGAAGINAAGTVGFVVVGTDGVAAPPVPRGEQVVYAFNAGARTLTRREVGIDAAPVVLASGLQSMTFTYQDSAGVVTPIAANVRTIVVSVVGQPQFLPATFQTGRVQVAMTDSIRLRNRAN